jgi:hypothetical protein
MAKWLNGDQHWLSGNLTIKAVIKPVVEIGRRNHALEQPNARLIDQTRARTMYVREYPSIDSEQIMRLGNVRAHLLLSISLPTP